MPGKVFIFGIDGATFDIILPMIEAGRAPNLARLLSQGTWGPLRSTIHPITPAAWTSFATGKNPGKHGVYDFSAPNRRTYGFKLNDARDRKAETVWSLLSRSGRTVTVVNVPFTYPPERVRGIQISGLLTPGADRSMSQPPEVYDDLVARFGVYSPDWSYPAGRRYDPESYREEVVDVIRRRAEVTLFLMEKHPWDVFMTVFQSIDHIEHVFYGMGEWGLEMIREAYEAVDEALGQVLSALDEKTTVMVVSDHGHGEIRKVFYLDQWLEREGYLIPKKGAILETLLRHLGKRSRKLAKALLPVRVRGSLRRRMPAVGNAVASLTAGQPVDWTRTRAYSGGMYGNIFVNLQGREAEGVVSPSEYTAVCDDIRERLLALEDPDTGEKVVEAVYHRDEVYSGPFVSEAPDLLIHWTDYAYFTKKGIDKKGVIFSDELTLDASSFPHSGTHRLDGVFVASGPGIRRGHEVSGLRLVDVAPTLLYLQDVAIPEDMDGRLASALFEEGVLEGEPPRYTTAAQDGSSGTDLDTGSREQDEDETLKERLRSLGYIE